MIATIAVQVQLDTFCKSTGQHHLGCTHAEQMLWPLMTPGNACPPSVSPLQMTQILSSKLSSSWRIIVQFLIGELPFRLCKQLRQALSPYIACHERSINTLAWSGGPDAPDLGSMDKKPVKPVDMMRTAMDDEGMAEALT